MANFRETIPLNQQSIKKHIYRCKNWFSRFGGFCYNSPSNSPTVAICTMAKAAVGILQPSQLDMPGGFARYATAGGFYYDPASNLLAYRAKTAVKCQ
jgi:hypothetical protein